MSRSVWKFNYIEGFLLNKIFSLKQKKGQNSFSVRTWSRASTISSDFVGLRFRVHNGKHFFPVVVTPDMVGHKLGEFAPTRIKYEFKKKKKKK